MDPLRGGLKQFDPQERLQAIHSRQPVLDKAALEAQIAAKQAATQEEQRRQREADAYRLAVDAAAVSLEQQRLDANAEERRRVAAVQTQQAAGAAASAAASAAHVGAPHPGASSAASLRQFDGEDRGFLDRKRQQQSQQAGWNADAAALAAMQAEAARAQAAVEHATLQAQLAYGANSYAAAQAARGAAASATSAANLALAAEKRDKDAADAAARSAMRHNALVVDDGPTAGAPRTEFRGFTPQQLGGVTEAQAQQRDAAAAARGAAAHADRTSAVHDAFVRKAQEKAAADVAAFQAQQRRAVAATVDAQRAQKEQATAAEAAAYKAPNMSDQFQSGFGRSAR